MHASRYERMRICPHCYQLYGIGKPDPNVDWYWQRCSCFPPAEEKWSRLDFNRMVELCYCCGARIVHSGSRWSLFFCEDCKERVVDFNVRCRKVIIPIGRHSLMNGLMLKHDEVFDEERQIEFVSKAGGLFKAIDHLIKWANFIIASNLRGMEGHVRLPDYLCEVAKLDTASAFDGMVEFFRAE